MLLAVFGLTLLVGGLAQQLEVSAAIGAFLVGLALSGPVQHRAGALDRPAPRPVRRRVLPVLLVPDPPRRSPRAPLGPAAALAVVAIATKLATGWFAAGRAGVGRAGRLRAGTTLMARGEFSIVIASLGATLDDGDDLGAVAAAFVLLTAIVGPLAARFVGAPPQSGRRTIAARRGPTRTS